jgi:hypothetical protein
MFGIYFVFFLPNTKAFGTFDHAFPLMGPVKAFMPTQGILLIAVLVALPHTPLYERLQKANRLHSGEGRDSNIEYLQPYEEVVANWKRVIRETYEPGKFTSAMLHRPRGRTCTASDQCVRWISSHGSIFGARSRSSHAPPGGARFVAVTEKNSGK